MIDGELAYYFFETLNTSSSNFFLELTVSVSFSLISYQKQRRVDSSFLSPR